MILGILQVTIIKIFPFTPSVSSVLTYTVCKTYKIGILYYNFSL